MKLRFINLGGVNQDFIIMGSEYYFKKISYYAEVEFVFFKKKIGYTSPHEKKKKQYEFALPYLLNGYNVIFDVSGKKYSSIKFSKFIDNLMLLSKDINFIVGGDEGFCEDIFKKANEMISFSDMTFNHEIFFLMLLEQTYRAFTIIKNHPYHK